MSRENPHWGTPRSHRELLRLGLGVSEASVSKYLTRHRNNHGACLASIDFFTVPTASFAILIVFILSRHERRRIAHVGVTAHLTAPWASRKS